MGEETPKEYLARREYEHHKKDLDAIVRRPRPTDWEAKLESWFEKCHSSKFHLNINRLAPYCVYLNYLPIFKYLVEHRVKEERADLTQRDNRGKSAIFYTTLEYSSIIGATDYVPMVEYIVSSYPEESTMKEMLDQKDKMGRTPLHYAVQCDNLFGTEFLLTMKASTEIKDLQGRTASDFTQLIHPTGNPRSWFQWDHPLHTKPIDIFEAAFNTRQRTKLQTRNLNPRHRKGI
ncbi:hypothetical protein GGR51DRAFT_577861 [Nemania sp. FL0031]|nr:hypothetical protein GGR51DRAFT_577861 [Nemania sp. FL0031]